MAGEQKLKEEDVLLMEQEGANRMDLLFFSNQQNVYKLKASDVADAKASHWGIISRISCSLTQGKPLFT